MTKNQVLGFFVVIAMLVAVANFLLAVWGVGVLLRTLLLTPLGVVVGFKLGRIRRSYLRDAQ